MKHSAALVLFFFSSQTRAAWEGSLFATQRSVFTYSAEDADKSSLTAEVAGSSAGSVGVARKIFPIGGEVLWSRNGYASVGPMVRTRIMPWAQRLRSDRDLVGGWDGQIQVGHGWSGPALGHFSSAFEFGLSLRAMLSDQPDQISSSGVAGGFWSMIFLYDLWSLQAEASLLGFSVGSQGRSGFHRDSNALRIRVARLWESESQWRIWGEYNHLHRTFTNSQYGFSNGIFVSDLALSFGVSRSF